MHYLSFSPQPAIIVMNNEDCQRYYRRAVIDPGDDSGEYMEVKICDRIIAIRSSGNLTIFYDSSLLPTFSEQYAYAVNQLLTKYGIPKKLHTKRGMLYWQDGTKFDHTFEKGLGQD